MVEREHRELLDLVPAIDRRIGVDRRDRSKHGARQAARRSRDAARAARADYDVAIDLQGLLKSAMLARSVRARARVVGFLALAPRAARAAVLHGGYDPGRGGCDPRETRHVVDMNLGLLSVARVGGRRRSFRSSTVDSASRGECASATGGRYALLNPGAAWPNKHWPPERFGAVAAVAARAARPARRWCCGGRASEAIAHDVVAKPRRRRDAVAADDHHRSRRARARRGADGFRRHRPAAHRRRGRYADRRLYGPTRPERNGPWSPHDVTVSRDAICAVPISGGAGRPSACSTSRSPR